MKDCTEHYVWFALLCCLLRQNPCCPCRAIIQFSARRPKRAEAVSMKCSRLSYWRLLFALSLPKPSSPFFSNAKRPLIPHLSAFPDTCTWIRCFVPILIQSIVNRTLRPTGAFRHNPASARYNPFHINSEVKAIEAVNKRVSCRRSYR